MPKDMDIRILSNRSELYSVDKTEQYVHFGFRPKTLDILMLCKKCQKLKKIFMPGCYIRILSKDTTWFLRDCNIELVEATCQGIRRDHGKEYYRFKEWN